MDAIAKETIIAGCLAYLRAVALPVPPPANAAEYGSWRAQVTQQPLPAEDAEDAWLDLDRLIHEKPEDAWELICELSSRTTSGDEGATLAAGPLAAFVRAHSTAYSSRIEEELARNAGFRAAYRWL